jgi:predicted nucleic acid-binding protein
MGDVVLDANVLVGYLDAHDVQHARASALIERLEAEGHEGVLLASSLQRPYRCFVAARANASRVPRT